MKNDDVDLRRMGVNAVRVVTLTALVTTQNCQNCGNKNGSYDGILPLCGRPLATEGSNGLDNDMETLFEISEMRSW